MIPSGICFPGDRYPHEWWSSLALVFAVPSVLGLIFYWNALAQLFNKVGAIGVKAAIFIGLLILNWPAEADIGF